MRCPIDSNLLNTAFRIFRPSGTNSSFLQLFLLPIHPFMNPSIISGRHRGWRTLRERVGVSGVGRGGGDGAAPAAGGETERGAAPLAGNGTQGQGTRAARE